MSFRPSAGASKPRLVNTRGIGGGMAVDPLHRQRFAGRAVPVDARAAKIGVAAEVLGELVGGRGLEAKIHFHPHRARERLDDLDEPEAPRVREEALGEPSGEEHVAEIALETAFDARAQNLHRDVALAFVVAHFGAVNLGDRSGGDRVAEFGEHLVDGALERRLDALDGELARGRRHAVLQPLELGGDLGSHDVGAGGEKLPELGVGGSEPIDGGGEAVGPADPSPREKIGERDRRARRVRQRARVELYERAFARQHEAGAR